MSFEKIQQQITAEISRLEKEGVLLKSDPKTFGSECAAAACYAIHSAYSLEKGVSLEGTPVWWPADNKHWNPGIPSENVVTAIAILITLLSKMNPSDETLENTEGQTGEKNSSENNASTG